MMAKRASADKCKLPQALWHSLEHLGLRPSAVLRQARLPATLHLNVSAVVTTAQLFAIWQAIEDLAADPGFAFRMVEASNKAGHHPAFLAAYYAADFRDAILRFVRFNGLAACERFRFKEGEGEYSIAKDWPHATGPEPAFLVDLAFALLMELGHRGTGKHVKPLRVDLARPNPTTDVQSGYFGCPVQFGASRNMLVLRSADVDRPFPNHNAEFLALLTPALADALGEAEMGSTTGEQVKVALKRMLASGRPELADVARDLGMSVRTLQRRINDEGTTFRTLLVGARQELGTRLLADPSIGIDAVALLLGYQDTSSFYRGFREWEGMTPTRWRELTRLEHRTGS